ncbi:MAG: Uma2 family endonuclease [Acidobacteriota bacterium]|nr:Uma2 family endonuclease [Acidobacteriota bacterium]
MATHPIDLIESGHHIDDSRYEYVEGRLWERPAPGEEHARFQSKLRGLLAPFSQDLGGKVLAEWSISDGSDIPHYWLIDPVESACYECLPAITPCAEKLTADRIEVAVSEIFR